MLMHDHLLILLFLFAGALSLTMALLAVGRRPKSLTWPFAALTFLTALWAFVYVFEITSANLYIKLYCIKIEYLAIATIPTLWLIFVNQYTGHSLESNRKLLALLLLEPAITLLLAWTNEVHHLIYARVTVDATSQFLLLNVVYGIWFWVHIIYSYLLTTVAVALIWEHYRNSGAGRWMRALVLLAATFIPWISNFIVAEFWQAPHIDLTPIFLVLGYLIVGIGIWKIRRTDVIPIARKAAIEAMSDAYLVLDKHLHILDLNKAAEASFHHPKSELIGRRFPDIAPTRIPLQSFLVPSLPFRRVVEIDGAFYEIHVEPISRRNNTLLGILATWRDITTYMVQKQLLEERVNQLNSVNYILGTINQAATLQEVYDAAMRSIRETLQADKAAILLLDQNGVMRFVAWYGLSEKYRKAAEGYAQWRPEADNPHPIFLEDIETMDASLPIASRDVFQEEGIRAIGFVPIIHQGRILGRLAVYYSAPRHCTKQEIELTEIIAGHLAIAIVKARLLEQAQNRLRRIEALQKIDAAISSTLELDHQIDTLLTHVINELQCDMSVVFLVEKTSGRIVPAIAKGSYDPEKQKCVSFEIGEGAVGWIVLHKQNLYIPDVSQDERWKQTESGSLDRIVSYLGIPLIVNGEVIGVLDVSTRTSREFTREEIEFLQMLGAQAAIAFKNAQLYQDLQKKVLQLEALNKISQELMSEHDIDALLHRIVIEATRLLNAPHGLIFLYDESRKLLTVAADSANLGYPISFGEGLSGRIAKTRRPMILENYSNWEHHSTSYADARIAAIIGTPMMHGGELIGVLVVYELEGSERKFTEEDIEPLSLLASQAASAVFNAQLIKRLHQRINRLQTLHQISAELSKLKGARESCHAVARLVHEKLGYDYVYVILLDPETQERLVVDCQGKGCQRVGRKVPKGRGLIERTIQQRKLHYWPDISKEADYHPGGADSKCEVDVPIQTMKQLFGVLVVEDDELDAFDQEDFDTLQTVANQLAIALENAQKVAELSTLLQTTTNLYQASQAIGRTETVMETVRVSAQSLKNALHAHGVYIQFFDKSHHIAYGVDRFGNELTDENGEKLAQEMSQVLKDIHAITTIEQRRLPEALQLQDAGRAIAFPLKCNSFVPGAILIFPKKNSHLSSQQMELVAIYANLTTIAIEKAISMEQANRRALEQESVSGIVRSLNETLDVEMALPRLVAGIRKLVAADRISLALQDENKDGLTLQVITNADDAAVEDRWEPQGGVAALPDILRGRIHITPDLADERAFPFEEQLYLAGYRSRVSMPLVVGDEVLGALNIVSRNPDEFSSEKLPPLLQIADALAISIANSLSLREERKRAQEITLLYLLSRRLSSLNTVKDVVNTTAEIMMKDIEGLIHAKIILTGAQFRTYVIPRTITGPYHAWVKDIRDYPAIARTLTPGIDCFRISREDPTLKPAEKELIFTRSGKFAWILPLASEEDPVGALVTEWNKQTCTTAEIRLVKSIAELLMMTLRRVFLFYEVEDAYLNAVLALALASDAKDSYTADHSQRLEEMAVAVAMELGLGHREIEDIRFGARLHDIGKIGVPDDILKKPGPLTDEEWEIMRKHPKIGEDILRPLQRLYGAARIVRHHHERYDGNGYPDGLAGDSIPLGARILTVVDAYSAITDRRVYKSGRPHETAIAEIKKNAGTQFDPAVVEAFLKLYEDSPPPFETNHDQR